MQQMETRGSRKECIRRRVNDVGKDDVEELRSLFEKIVWNFCKDSGGMEEVDPFPPYLSDDKRVDLLKLFEAVRIRGGCKRIYDTGMWDSIAVELGGSCGVLEVIYMKYLNELDQRLAEILSAEGSQIAKGSTEISLAQLKSKALEAKSKGIGDHKLRLKEAASNNNSGMADADKNDLDSMIKEFAMVLLGRGATSDYHDNDKNALNSKTGAINTGVGSRKRKRGCMDDMFKWVTRIAKHPMKSAAEISQKSSAYYTQSLLARQVLFVKGPEAGKENSQVQVIKYCTSFRKLQNMSLLSLSFLITFKFFFLFISMTLMDNTAN